MPLFDFHVHPAMKASFQLSPKSGDALKLVTKKDLNNTIKCIAGEGHKTFTSQINYTTLLKSIFANQGGIILGNALYAPEKAILEGLLKSLKRGKGRFKDPFGKQFQYEKVDSALDPTNGISPFDWTIETYELSEGLRQKGWLFSIRELKGNALPADGCIYEFYGVEGCHAIADHIDPTKIKASAIIRNLQALLDKDIPIMNLMLVHMEQSPLANHAYGIQMLDDDKENSFKPTGKTITDGAFDIINFCNKNKIYIDVKHMSYAARQAFYNQWPNMTDKRPVVCSHAGIAGISADLYRDYVINTKKISSKSVSTSLAKPLAFGGWSSFNPVSINLYDEDIEFIINSGGLIGISMDMRIIGVSKIPSVPTHNKYPLPYEEEYLAITDLISHGSPVLSIPDTKPKYPPTPLHLNFDDLNILAQSPANNVQYHRNCFVAQFIHVMNIAMKKCGKTQEQALKYVSFGSDMDGLIAGMYSMQDYTEYNQKFQKEFISAFKFIWKEGVKDGSISGTLKISDSIIFKSISHQNGFDFIKNWL